MTETRHVYGDFSSRLTGTKSRRLWKYWISKLEGGNPPGWSDIELMDIYDVAPHLVILDVIEVTDPQRLSYRYVGSNIAESRWKLSIPDPTGRDFHGVEHQYDFNQVTQLHHECIFTKKPEHMRAAYNALDAYGDKERLVLPLLTKSGEIDKIISLRERLTQTIIDRPVSFLPRSSR